MVPYLRGLAYLEMGFGDEAAAEFSKVLEWPSSVPQWALDSVSLVGLARAHTLSDRTDEARRAYQNLFEKWGQADEGLQILEQARAEYEALK